MIPTFRNRSHGESMMHNAVATLSNGVSSAHDECLCEKPAYVYRMRYAMSLMLKVNYRHLINAIILRIYKCNYYMRKLNCL